MRSPGRNEMSNVDVIRRLYDSFATKDYEAFKRLCDPSLEWVQNEGFPNGGRHRGADAVVEKVFLSLREVWEGFAFQAEKILDAGEHVIVLGAYSGRHKTTGKSFKAAASHVYDLNGGLVIRFCQYTDTGVIRDAASDSHAS